MVLPLIVAVCVLSVLVLVMAGYIAIQHTRQSDIQRALTNEYEARISEMHKSHRSELTAYNKRLREMHEHYTTTAVDNAQVLDLVANVVKDTVQSVTSGIQSIYGQPINHDPNQAATATLGDPGPIPYGYDRPDYSDPTDTINGVRADGEDYGGDLIADDDPNPFGVAGLGIDPAIPVSGPMSSVGV